MQNCQTFQTFSNELLKIAKRTLLKFTNAALQSWSLLSWERWRERELKSRGITPTLMTFNAIMDGCVRNEEMSKAARIKLQSCWSKPRYIARQNAFVGAVNAQIYSISLYNIIILLSLYIIINSLYIIWLQNDVMMWNAWLLTVWPQPRLDCSATQLQLRSSFWSFCLVHNLSVPRCLPVVSRSLTSSRRCQSTILCPIWSRTAPWSRLGPFFTRPRIRKCLPKFLKDSDREWESKKCRCESRQLLVRCHSFFPVHLWSLSDGQGFCATGDMQSAFAIFEQLQKGRESPDEVACLGWRSTRRATMCS